MSFKYSLIHRSYSFQYNLFMGGECQKCINPQNQIPARDPLDKGISMVPNETTEINEKIGKEDRKCFLGEEDNETNRKRIDRQDSNQNQREGSNVNIKDSLCPSMIQLDGKFESFILVQEKNPTLISNKSPTKLYGSLLGTQTIIEEDKYEEFQLLDPKIDIRTTK